MVRYHRFNTPLIYLPVSKFRSTLPTYHVNTTASVRNAAVGKGEGTTKSAAKSNAATQALEHFHANGIPE